MKRCLLLIVCWFDGELTDGYYNQQKLKIDHSPVRVFSNLNKRVKVNEKVNQNGHSALWVFPSFSFYSPGKIGYLYYRAKNDSWEKYCQLRLLVLLGILDEEEEEEEEEEDDEEEAVWEILPDVRGLQTPFVAQNQSVGGWASGLILRGDSVTYIRPVGLFNYSFSSWKGTTIDWFLRCSFKYTFLQSW